MYVVRIPVRARVNWPLLSFGASTVRALERMHVPYYVNGSLASSLHGEPRATNDADLVAVRKAG